MTDRAKNMPLIFDLGGIKSKNVARSLFKRRNAINIKTENSPFIQNVGRA